MRKEPLYRILASLAQAEENCAKFGNEEWRIKHRDTLLELVRDHMPSGSGIDNGTQFDAAKSTPGKLVFNTSYHHMNDGGMYDGWTEHSVIVTPSFDGISLKITGRDRNDIKEYLHERFHGALTEEIERR